MVRLFSALVTILIISGFPERSFGYDDYYYYEEYYNEPNENVPKAIIGQQARGNCLRSSETVALRENFVDSPESYDSFSAKSCIFLAHGKKKTRTV
jgi:hypothetical protein